MITVKLPVKFVQDYLDRSPLESETGETHFEVLDQNKRYITMNVTKEGLEDLLDDVTHYADAYVSSDYQDLIQAARRCEPYIRKALT